MTVFTLKGQSFDQSPAYLSLSNNSFASAIDGPTATPNSDNIITLVSPDVAADDWEYRVWRDGTIVQTGGPVRIAGDSVKVIFGSCQDTSSDPAVFTEMATENADLFMHLGDMSYHDRTSTDYTAYLADIEGTVFGANLQTLISKTPTIFTGDDHDRGANNHEGNTTSSEAAARAFRERFTYPGLSLTGSTDGTYGHVDLGSRVRVIYTDQRRYGGDKSATDDISKSILGAAQKTWLQALLEASTDKFVILCSSRVFHATTQSGSDHWGGFTAEREWLCNIIQANFATNQLIVITGDQHQMGIDDGTNCDYSTTSHATRCFMAAPFSQSNVNNGNATWSTANVYNNGQYGVVETSLSGSTITVTLTGKLANGTTEMTASYSHAFT